MNSSEFKSMLLTWQDKFLAYLPNLFFALLTLLVTWLIAKAVLKCSNHIHNRIRPEDHHFGLLLGWALYSFTLMSGVFLALDILKLTQFLTHILAGAGIVGIVAGFALKDISSNLFASFLIRGQAPFKGGDWVKLNGVFGQIDSVGFMTTSVKTIEGQRVYVPNQLVYSTNFCNYSTFNRWRVTVKCGVSYGDDLDKVRTIVLDEVSHLSICIPDTEVECYFTDIGASTYNFETRFWIAFSDYEQYEQAVNNAIIAIKKRFAQENISIAYNVLTLDFGVKGGVPLSDTVMPVKLLPEAQSGNS